MVHTSKKNFAGTKWLGRYKVEASSLIAQAIKMLELKVYFSFVWNFSNFHLFETSTIPVKGCRFWTVLGILAINREGSLACHTNCDMGHPFIIIVSEDPWHQHLLPSVYKWRCNYLFKQLRSVVAGIRTHNLPLAGQTLLPTAPPLRPQWLWMLREIHHKNPINLK